MGFPTQNPLSPQNLPVQHPHEHTQMGQKSDGGLNRDKSHL